MSSLWMVVVVCAAGCATGRSARSGEDGSATLATAQLQQPLTTERSQPGDHFTLELLDPVVGPDGRELIGRGALLEGVVRRAIEPGLLSGARFDLELVGVRVEDEGLVPVQGEVADAPIELSSRFAQGLTGGLAGAAAGSGAGLAIDNDSAGTVIGSAVVGAGVGALVGTLATPLRAEIPAGSIVTLRFARDLRLPHAIEGNRGYKPPKPVVCAPPKGEEEEVPVAAEDGEAVPAMERVAE